MKKLILVLIVVLIPSFIFAGDIYTRGHWKDTDHDGVKDTYIDPYHKTTPNNTKDDNYSTYPNYNPYTGKQGTQKNDNDNYNYNNSGNSNKRYKSRW
ncbi:MAG: hypothetical protein WA104_02220 [Thermodesulfovibrionales bacterium]